jgi:hypothetical protein
MSANSSFLLPFNPSFTNGSYDMRLNEMAYRYKREAAFLGHIWPKYSPCFDSDYGSFIRRLPISKRNEPPSFPEGKFLELISKGFLEQKRPNIRDALITILLHGAGFRESEPFHLFIEDVFPDPLNSKSAMVVFHDPLHGLAPRLPGSANPLTRKTDRSTYLREYYKTIPRTLRWDGTHAGWKGGLLDGKYYMRAYWFPAVYGELFKVLWDLYMIQIAPIERDHPYAFVNISRGTIGAEYSISKYNRSHMRACEKIGLVVSKANGTTAHGHRHAYARRLASGSINPKIRKILLHHRSIESQFTYLQASSEEVNEALNNAEGRMKSQFQDGVIAAMDSISSKF